LPGDDDAGNVAPEDVIPRHARNEWVVASLPPKAVIDDLRAASPTPRPRPQHRLIAYPAADIAKSVIDAIERMGGSR